MSTPGSRPVTAIAAGSYADYHQELFAIVDDEIFGLKGNGKVVHAWNWLSDDGKPDWESRSEWSKWHWMPNVS